MSFPEVFTVFFFGAVGLGVVIFLALVVLETCFGYKLKKMNSKKGGYNEP